MKCTYGLSSKLPSFFDKKYFSCNQGCLTRNVVDICDEESLIIETVQETLQKTLTPLLERAMNVPSLTDRTKLVPSLSDRIINVLENSVLKDEVAKTKLKHPQSRRKMKRRKKRKPQTKCDIIREGEVHAPRSFTLFENEYLLNNVAKCDSYVSSKDSTHSYDNNSFSHITSEKESAYSEKPSVGRKRKKLQRRKKRKPKLKTNKSSLNLIREPINSPEAESSVTGKDNNSFDEDEEDCISIEIPSWSCDHVSDNIQKFPGQPPNYTISFSEYKESILTSSVLPRTNAVQTRDSGLGNKYPNIYKSTKNDSDTTIECDTNIIDKYTRNVGKDVSGSYTNILGEDSVTNNVVGGGHFSKEQKRQLRRKMRNVKKRPESYVVLGMI